MTELQEIVKRATGLAGAIAADLAVFGGILRCNSCGAEQPVGDIGGKLRNGWPECHGLTMTWVTRKLLLAEQRDVPDGYELAAVISGTWRLASGKRCRAGAGYHHRACGMPSVAEFNRGLTERPRWWSYCPDHLYANWAEGGKVMHWVLRVKGNDSA
jgi:hypothetical protein